MLQNSTRVHDYARILLASTRLINGAAALVMPATLIRRLGDDPDTNGVALYAFRMFGIRTIIIGIELLMPGGDVRAQAVRTAIPIHTSDVVAATIVGVRRLVPPRVALMIVLISTVNTILAIVARPGKE